MGDGKNKSANYYISLVYTINIRTHYSSKKLFYFIHLHLQSRFHQIVRTLPHFLRAVPHNQ